MESDDYCVLLSNTFNSCTWVFWSVYFYNNTHKRKQPVCHGKIEQRKLLEFTVAHGGKFETVNRCYKNRSETVNGSVKVIIREPSKYVSGNPQFTYCIMFLLVVA